MSSLISIQTFDTLMVILKKIKTNKSKFYMVQIIGGAETCAMCTGFNILYISCNCNSKMSQCM